MTAVRFRPEALPWATRPFSTSTAWGAATSMWLWSSAGASIGMCKPVAGFDDPISVNLPHLGVEQRPCALRAFCGGHRRGQVGFLLLERGHLVPDARRQLAPRAFHSSVIQ